ncbi:flagellar hook-associated protein FlgL [Azotobacter chroococcum]|uniref:Flagellar hook-associated protein 3 FlgL n=1 Tax=Azotobacter chroococcum TaxID=353 RepID=A0A4V2Q798_9GAMM|nr:flagellar hook-associated protein FlgL [Azotobacter chroococcum]TBV97533.1 flagellar hook-associated protein 3 [Azotobacter chroococcum]TCL28077.1 flagellar hook-associated protein 3 FlgL [Azotobacter chroococcum]
MRISTVTMFEQGLNSLVRQQGEYLKVGQQIASGKRVVNPSDDPQAASQAVGVAQSAAVNQQYADARISTRNALSQEESVLDSVADAIASAKTLLVQAGNGTLSDADRSSLASELSGIYEALLGQANATDGNGRYLFGGYQDKSPPFVKDALTGIVSYQGDAGVVAQQVDASRQMASGDNGLQIFQTVHGSASYLARADAANAGSVTFTGPSVTDSSDAGFGTSFTLVFAVAADGTTTYSTDGGTTPVPYVDGQSISVNGLSLTLEGTPADGDSIAVSAADEADPDLFRTLKNMLDALNTPLQSDADRARLQNTLSTSSRELDNALDNVLTTRASVGARLNELDVLDTVGGNRALNYEQTLSDLVDLDYNAAISEYSLRQVGLQAAQKTFVDIHQLSLFKLL